MVDSKLIHMEKSHPGKAGRKPLPSTLVNRALAIVDKRIPEIFEALIQKAIEGDREAQIYLIDRRLGKPKQQTDIDITGQELGAGLLLAVLQAVSAERRRLTGVKLIEGGKDAIQRQIEGQGSSQGANEEKA